MSSLFAVLGRLMPLRSWIVLAVVAVLLIGLIVAVLAWGNGRYRQGQTDADARWQEASSRLERQARQAGTAADRQEAERIEDHAARVAREKEKIDEATASGASPLDALFGGV